MRKGIITKLIGGLYTVKSEGEFIELKARGNLRYKGQSPKVGDYVTFTETINEVLERKNDLVRPAISNVDLGILIFSAVEPDISYSLLDRFISLMEFNNITPVIVITKIDLCTNLTEIYKNLEYYKNLYDIYFVDSKNKKGLDEIKEIFADNVSVFTGQTGVGKSSLLNALGSFELRTGEISKALGRGKHTTRHSELFELYDGLIADTPGFSSLEFINMKLEDVRDSFVDFDELSDGCRYRGCFHDKEPLRDCKVKQEVENGNVLKSRYESYLAFLEEIRNTKVKY